MVEVSIYRTQIAFVLSLFSLKADQAEDGSLDLRKFSGDEVLEGGEVMPDFSAAVRDILPAVEQE